MNKKIIFLTLLAVVLFLPMVTTATQDPEKMVEAVKDLAVTIGTAIVVIGWVIAGILYLTAAGAPEKIGTAKKALIACIVGTILIILAQSGYSTLKAMLNKVLNP